MEIVEVKKNKKQYLSLLLLGDEQEDMIDRYLERGTMYVLRDSQTVAECVVAEEGEDILEIKNIAVLPKCQRQGYGKIMIDFLKNKYQNKYRILQVGTGESPLTLPFYEACGFQISHRIVDFFTENYAHPIYEGGVLLRDMVYLQIKL